MSQPVFSIIIVVYNGVATLEETLQSVIRQDFSSREIVLIDGNSSDGTKDICERYRDRVDFYLSEPDQGIYDAMNKGIQASKGKYIYFLGSDDTFVNESVLTDVYNTGCEGIDLIYGTILLKSNKRRFGKEKTYLLLMEENISHQAIFFNRDLFLKAGYYDTRYKILSDYEYNLRVFKMPGVTKKFIPVDVCLFNDKGGASNTVIDGVFFKNMLEKFVKEEGFSPGSGKLQKYNFFYGISLLFSRGSNGGWRYITRALLNGPRKFYYLLVLFKMILSFKTFFFKKPGIL